MEIYNYHGKSKCILFPIKAHTMFLLWIFIFLAVRKNSSTVGHPVGVERLKEQCHEKFFVMS